MKIEELLVQYQGTTGMDPSVLQPFLQGLEDVGATLEAAHVKREDGPTVKCIVALATAQGLAIVRVHYPDRATGTIEATLQDWRSVTGLKLRYDQGPKEEPAWTLSLSHPELKISNLDSSKIRGLAAAILRHISPR